MRKALEYFVTTHQLPNAETMQVIDDARKEKNLTKIDNFSDFLETL